MEKRIISILVLSILSIVTYVNFNDVEFGFIDIKFWRLIYYFQYEFIVGLLIWLLWILFTNKLIRILTIPIGLYFTFHFAVNLIEIIDPLLKDKIYTTKIINYILSLSLGLSILISIVYVHSKRFINRKFFKQNERTND